MKANAGHAQQPLRAPDRAPKFRHPPARRKPRISRTSPIGGLARTLFVLAVVSAACSDSGPTGVQPPPEPSTPPPGLPGKVTLPDGVSLDPASLTVLSDMGEVNVAADGTFHLEVMTAGATVDVLSSAGKLVMVGAADAAGESIEVSATTTARELLYLALGAFVLPFEHETRVRELIAQAPQTAQIASLLAERMRANPAVIADGDEALEDGLAAARAAILDGDGAALASASMPTASAPTGIGGIANLLIDPAGAVKSGVGLVHDEAAGVAALNRFRRPSALLLYRTGYDDADGRYHELPQPEPVGAVDVPATGRLSALTTLYGVISGSAPWSPEQSDPLVVPPSQGRAKTYFEAVLLGPSLDFVTPMPIMQDSRFYAFAAEWNAIITDKSQELFWDAVMVPVLTAMTLGSMSSINRANQANWRAFVDRTRSLYDPHLASLGVMLRSKDGYAYAMRFVLQEMRSGNYRLDFINTIRDALSASERNKANLAAMEKRLDKRVNAGAIAALVGAVLTAGDIAAVIKDLVSSLEAESWQVTAVLPNIVIQPSPARVTANARSVIFEASVVGHPDVVFAFRWTTTGNHGELHDDTGGSGLVIGPTAATGKHQVQYIATTPVLPSGTLDEVTVRVSILNLDAGTTEEVGTATATIEGPDVEYEVRIVPQSQSVMPSHSVVYRAIIEPWPDQGALFRWTTSGDYGDLSPAAGTLTGSDQVTYFANPGGDGGEDTIGVEVFISSLDPPIGSATALVVVEPAPPDPTLTSPLFVVRCRDFHEKPCQPPYRFDFSRGRQGEVVVEYERHPAQYLPFDLEIRLDGQSVAARTINEDHSSAVVPVSLGVLDPGLYRLELYATPLPHPRNPNVILGEWGGRIRVVSP